jgi:hypothetical protein
MPHPFDIGQLADDIRSAASGVLGENVTAISGFSNTQVQLMAKQAAWIAEGTAKGELSGELRDFFLKNLADIARNFVRVLQGLVLVTIEKIWNAVIDVLWNAIRGAVGNISLPIPTF